MTRRREIEPLQRITVNVYERDYRRLGELYASFTPAKIIRSLIRIHLQKYDRLRAEEVEELIPEIEIDLESAL